MLFLGWVNTWADGKAATLQELVSVLANAPESIMQTELVRTFIDDFYDKQKKYLILRGFIPFVIYSIGNLGYLTATRANNKWRDEDEQGLGFVDYGFIAILILGTLYFTILEGTQIATLKTQYVRLSNLADIVYLTINYFFIVDVFLGSMTQ